jgi:hypothetical protein
MRAVIGGRAEVFVEDGVDYDAHVDQFLGLEGQTDVAVQNGRPQRESNPWNP